jgi:hypothetical protein
MEPPAESEWCIDLVLGKANSLLATGKTQYALDYLTAGKYKLNERVVMALAKIMSSFKQNFVAVCLIQGMADRPNMQETCKKLLKLYQAGCKSVEVANRLCKSPLRVCSILGCNEVEEKMARCPFCRLHHLCKQHAIFHQTHLTVCSKVIRGPHCHHCLTPSAVKLPKCSKCLSIAYCNEKCQKRDWAIHKLHCRK